MMLLEGENGPAGRTVQEDSNTTFTAYRDFSHDMLQDICEDIQENAHSLPVMPDDTLKNSQDVAGKCRDATVHIQHARVLHVSGAEGVVATCERDALLLELSALKKELEVANEYELGDSCKCLHFVAAVAHDNSAAAEAGVCVEREREREIDGEGGRDTVLK